MIRDLQTHPRRYVTVKDLVVYCGLPQSTVYWHVQRGFLASERYGGRKLIPLISAQLWFDRYVLSCRKRCANRVLESRL